MASIMINQALVHPLQYPDQGQNYVFNGCMKLLGMCWRKK